MVFGTAKTVPSIIGVSLFQSYCMYDVEQKLTIQHTPCMLPPPPVAAVSLSPSPTPPGQISSVAVLSSTVEFLLCLGPPPVGPVRVRVCVCVCVHIFLVDYPTTSQQAHHIITW